MQSINEKSSGYLEVALFDRAGAPAVPSSVTYRIDCLTSGDLVRTWTAATPAAVVQITLTPTDNAMRRESSATEKRRVTLVASYGAGLEDQMTSEFDYQVRNLKFVQ